MLDRPGQSHDPKAETWRRFWFGIVAIAVTVLAALAVTTLRGNVQQATSAQTEKTPPAPASR